VIDCIEAGGFVASMTRSTVSTSRRNHPKLKADVNARRMSVRNRRECDERSDNVSIARLDILAAKASRRVQLLSFGLVLQSYLCAGPGYCLGVCVLLLEPTRSECGGKTLSAKSGWDEIQIHAARVLCGRG